MRIANNIRVTDLDLYLYLYTTPTLVNYYF